MTASGSPQTKKVLYKMIFCCQCFPSSRVATELERPETTWSNGRKPPEIEVMVRDQTTYDHDGSKVRSIAPEGVRPMHLDRPKSNGHNNIAAETFTFRDLATATKNFKHDFLVGEGAFGRVYKGNLQRLNRVVAVKQLDRNGLQGDKDFLMEVMVLSHLHHQNLVNLIGYCADGKQRLLVYDYMPLGSLQNHLFGISSEQRPLDWFTRMKIALGAAKGLEYLHNKANPQFIYRDLKSCSILLDDDFNAKLSGLAKRGSTAEEKQIRVTGTYGYSAPEQERAGQVTAKSDVYSFGVVLLELITGRAAVDPARSSEDQNLVKWAQPMFRDPSRYAEMADPRLGGEFPESGLKQAVGVAVMCLQEEAEVRPLILDVVNALSILGTDPAAAPSAMIRIEASHW